MNSASEHCQKDLIAAYIDGELDNAASANFETHVSSCADCRADLAEQKRLLCTLDSGLSRTADLRLPKDFARVVAARAESDMSGMRGGRERRRALRLCVLLAVISFALLGTAASKAIIVQMLNRAMSLAALIGHTLYDAVSGTAIITRVLGKGVIQGSPLIGISALLFLAVAVFLLSRLIANYHRTRFSE